ncbi:MAG TPA: hypothetical protein PKC30_01600 [Saprospiraceae bacterium]|nr:hypothetical protein [Saprospiraceae bacterium]
MKTGKNLKETLKTFRPIFKTWVMYSMAGGLLVAIITLFLPNYYKGITVFYAASPDLSNPAPLSVSQDKILLFGSGEDMDRMLSIAHTHRVYNRLIDSFDLYNHYKIDPSSEHARHKLIKRMNKHYQVKKTRFRGIEISFEDKDPVVAARVANAAREFISDHARDIIRNSQKSTLDNYLSNLSEKNAEIRYLQDSLAQLKKYYGILKAESQAEVLATHSAEINLEFSGLKAKIGKMRQMSFHHDTISQYETRLAAITEKKKEINQQWDSFNQGVGKVEALENQISLSNNQLGLIKERYQQLMAVNQSSFKTIHLVEEAWVPDYKSRPVRSFIIILSVVTIFITLTIFQLIKMAWYSNEI